MLIRNIMATILMMASLVAYGAETEENDDALIVEVQASYQASRNKEAQRSLFSQMVYLEKPIDAEYSVFGSVYNDQEFRSLGVGVAKKFGDFQLAIGVGKAYYDGNSHTMPHGFVYYLADGFEGLLYAEKYLKETVDSVFVKGYLTRQFGSWIVGGYAETGMGLGPYVGYKLSDSMKVTVTVPVVARPHRDDGGVKFKVNLTATF